MDNHVSVHARCERVGKLFQIVFEEQGMENWVAQRSLLPPIAGAARGQAVSPLPLQGIPQQLSGSFAIAPEYPGCPHCGAPSFWRCSACTELNCWDNNPTVMCAWCRRSGHISGTIDGLNSAWDAPALEKGSGRPALPPPPASHRQRPGEWPARRLPPFGS